MKALLLVALAAGCATAPAAKRPDESHRIPVNRSVPAEVEGAGKPNQAGGTEKRPRREWEVQWR